MSGAGATSKLAYLRLVFRYGPLVSASMATAVTNLDEPVSADGVDYHSIPAMEVKGLQNTGALDAKRIEITVPSGLVLDSSGDDPDFFNYYATGKAGAPVHLWMDEVIRAYGPSAAGNDLDDLTILQHAVGDYRLEKAFKNPDRQYGFIKYVFAHHKNRIGTSLGMASTPQCQFTLGDKSCQAFAVVPETATIAAVDGKKVTLTNPADAAVVTGRPEGDSAYWQRGYMDVDGTRIGIRLWTDGSYDFYLVKEAPPWWVGATVTLRPGCGKTPSDCDGKFSNLEHFGGFGIAMPAYQPDRELS